MAYGFNASNQNTSFQNNQFGGYNQGGFLPSNQNQDDNKDGKKVRNVTIRHVTIKQLKSIEPPAGKDDAIFLDGLELGQVILVGAVAFPEIGETFTTFKIEDGTGSIDVRVFTTGQGDLANPLAFQLQTIRPNSYIRVVGQVKAFGGSIQVMGINIRPLVDGNELTAHFLEAIRFHLELSRPKKGSSFSTPAAPMSYTAPQSYNNNSNTFNQFQNSRPAMTQFNSNQQDAFAHSQRKAILSVIHERSKNGQLIGLADLKKGFSQQMDPATFDSSFSWLLEEGHVYQHDENSFKADNATY